MRLTCARALIQRLEFPSPAQYNQNHTRSRAHAWFHSYGGSFYLLCALCVQGSPAGEYANAYIFMYVYAGHDPHYETSGGIRTNLTILYYLRMRSRCAHLTVAQDTNPLPLKGKRVFL